MRRAVHYGVGAVAAAALAAGGAVVLDGAPAAATPVSQPFTTPGETSFEVPAGICFVTITADGGHGGASGTPQAGGAGAHVSARVHANPSSVLDVLVGGAGADGAFGTAAAGGDGGIGGGGANNSDPLFAVPAGGGGGGASVVNAATASVVAGGGGGGGYGAGGGGGASDGGGGGSSFVSPETTNASSASSTRTGDGQVIISYDPATDTCPTPTTPPAPATRPVAVAPAAQPVAAVPRFTG